MNMLSYIKSFFSCKNYSECCSRKRDQQLSISEKLHYLFHHAICFTCRRFSKQLDSLDKASNMLKEHDLYSKEALSEEAKTRILESIKREENLS